MKLLEKLKAHGPKRILSLDGGGIRGAITLGYLESIERIIREQHNDPEMRLCDYFDLIGGTSTGSIIASALAIGMNAGEIKQMYMDLGGKIFAKKNFNRLKATYNVRPLEEELKNFFGDTLLGGEEIQTGLCIVAKRADTGSTWPLINHPEGKYYKYNAPILLRNAVRASSAAPTYFVPVKFDVGNGEEAAFIDGGVSMANNPAFQLFLVATLKGFPFKWKKGENNLMIVSVGTGISHWHVPADEVVRNWIGKWAVQLPDMFMKDANWQNELMLQYLSNSPTAFEIDSEVGDLRGDLIASEPSLHYLRYNVILEETGLNSIGCAEFVPKLESLREMSETANRFDLAVIGERAAKKQISDEHFPLAFVKAKEPIA